MNSLDPSQASPRASSVTGYLSPVWRLVPLALSLTALLLSFWGLFEWDVPLTRFVRSLNDFHIDHLANPWLAQLSDLGDRLGRGEWLVGFSLALLAIGYGLTWSVWKEAGWQSLLAHGLAALTSNVLKHLVGRARPKFMHSGHVEFSPAGGSGWDSFPSGHATACFAVAAVLAVRFPKARWVIISLAMAIAVSRILRGSHFLTDTVVGAALGYAVGTFVSHPWREWRMSLSSALVAMTPFPVVLFALVTVIGHRRSDLWPIPQLIVAGFVLTLIGLIGHVLQTIKAEPAPTWLSKSLSQGLIGLGLGMTTGSLWVTTAVLSVCIAHWLRQRSAQPPTCAQNTAEPYALTREAVFSLLVLLGLLASMELRGALPIL